MPKKSKHNILTPIASVVGKLEHLRPWGGGKGEKQTRYLRVALRAKWQAKRGAAEVVAQKRRPLGKALRTGLNAKKP